MLLSMAGVSKSFSGVRALDGVDLEVCSGEIHALVGENGAGKSTLIKVLGGAVVPDRGQVWLEGAPLPLGDPRQSRQRGINIIYQELTLVPELTVAENIFLGRESGGLFLRAGEMRRRAGELLGTLGARMAPTDRVGALSVAQQQVVEIARALSQRSRALVLDEPSATLTRSEVERLFAVLRDLRRTGLGILYVSHRLEEIFEIADRVTVLRDGRKVETAPMADLSRPALIRWMVGRDLSEEFPPRSARSGEPVLEIRHLSSPPGFDDVSLTVHRGEVVGLAGLVGAGRTSLALAVFGVLSSRGEVRLGGRPARFRHPREAIDAGLAYVTEDRKRCGIFPLLDAGMNITMAHLAAFTTMGLLSSARERKAAERAATDVGLRSAGLGQIASTLSGGNQQKLLLARYLIAPPKVLVLDEPTRGIDVGAKAEIYRLMNQLTDAGLGVLMVSSELPEVLAMSDRVVVIQEGRTAGALAHAEATAERVMDLATGGR
jgi:ABC-type sugar transport system ATPase subunit